MISQAHSDELFSQIFGFGDSLSDIGNLKAPVMGMEVPLIFTDKTVTFQNVSSTLKLNLRPSVDGGNDYAVAGNTSKEILLSVTSDTPYTPNANQAFIQAQKQNTFFMKYQGQADRKALYLLMGGGNDVKDIVNKSRTPLHAAQNLIESANALHNFGARYIIITNVPDVGETPGGENLLKDSRAQLNLASNQINSALLNNLHKSQANMLFLNLNGLVKEVSQNPASFGFVDLPPQNVPITCMVNKDPGVPCVAPSNGSARIITGDAQKSVYWDGFHGTSVMNRIASDYILQAIRGATEIGSLPRIADSHSTTLDNSIFNEMAQHRWQELEPGTLSFFGGGAGVENQIYDAVDNKTNDSKGYFIHAGLHYQLTEGLKLGAALQGAETRHEPEQSNYKTDSVGGSLFVSYQRERFFSNAAVNYLDLDYKNKRGFHLGAHTRKESSSTSGKLYGLTLDAGYALYDNGQLKAGPIVSASYHKSSTDGFTESGDNQTAMVFGDQELDFKNAAAGVFLDAINDKTRLGIQIDYNKDLNNDDLRTINLQQKGISRMAYLPADISNNDALRMKVRLGHNLTPEVEVYGSYQVSKADDYQTDYQALQLGISWSL
ncbi:hypothetical protein GZ78_11975 [Endozoicomonas numazuensis]|uniref:Autotransporter domain-containing protein n=2 Tax=Endozoicomonas numazuensis TaxID=1137799 RepID=A0A081NIG7_9GAMM|nr:hypothetical protein GZ78_11975 [Endozoicomonas numazuensis]